MRRFKINLTFVAVFPQEPAAENKKRAPRNIHEDKRIIGESVFLPNAEGGAP